MRGQVRIIGGNWRGRKLTIPEVSGVRPTPDRVRETLFNWLAPVMPGARCLDLFAGSGALGFEALSRGAAFVMMVDQSPLVIKALRSQLAAFKGENAEITQATLPAQWPLIQKPFDIVFLDPPYKENLLFPICNMLEEKKFLADSALIYLESDQPIESCNLPSNWKILKCKKAGQVGYYLAERTGVVNETVDSN
ncbi:MAG TPA: 16S rRNA (guanine(966)-N(2))-methyltransferase RsmD [Gammaproteobacteria bacterium]|nr:16S rRNA (guanine(966)-N(2))-methyltransferase RsmD [Gammaproteobacteria bacterium]